MQLDIQMLLDSFETPAIFYRENTVRYFNQWAKSLFPTIVPGKGLPEGFGDPDSPFEPEAHVTQRGTLYLLRHRSPPAAGDTAQIIREVRNCLTTLTAASEALAENLRGQTGEENLRLLELSNQKLYRLRRLADHSDLLRQLESRAPNLYREGSVDLAALCRELSAQVKPLAARAGTVFHLEGGESAVLTLGDAALLQRMLLNLVSNSLRALSGGGEICLRLEKKDSRAVLTFWDDGPGMDERQLLHVFQPKPRRHALPPPEENACLGLRLVREIVVLHRGVILAENRPEGGVRMTISLPLRRPGQQSLRSVPAWGDDGFQLALTELSDALPAGAYSVEELDG